MISDVLPHPPVPLVIQTSCSVHLSQDGCLCQQSRVTLSITMQMSECAQRDRFYCACFARSGLVLWGAGECGRQRNTVVYIHVRGLVCTRTPMCMN